MNLPDDIVQAIVADLQDRQGLKNAWWDTELDIRYEIMSEWRNIVRDKLQAAFNKIASEA